MTQPKRDRDSTEAMRAVHARALREAVHRQWRLGLTDTAIGRVLGIRREKAKAERQALGLPANKHGVEE